MYRFVAVIFLWLMIGCQTDVVPTVVPTATQPPTVTPEVGVLFATLAPPTMAIVQITPSPRPTATPTPTATPVIYSIRSGDTLWSIALQNRTLPETLEALNPNLRPESLQIGQEIVLPPKPTALAAAAVGTEVPIEIVVNSVAFYRTPLGDGWVLGEIENVGLFSAENIRLQIGLLNAQGNALADIDAVSAAPLLPPGAKAPFAAQIADFTTAPETLKASVVAGNTVTAIGTRYLDLIALDPTFVDENAHLRVSATISNSGTLTPTTLSVITTLYDDAGNVNGMAQRTVAAPLVQGGQLPFSAELVPLSPNTRRISLFVFGRVEP